MKKGDYFEVAYQVTEELYKEFILLFQDRNPMHTDEEFAQKNGFSGKVMHGNILNGFLSNFIGECLPEKSVIIHSQSIAYRRPVYLNDSLLLNATIDSISAAVAAASFSFSFRNQNGEKVANGKIQIGLIR